MQSESFDESMSEAEVPGQEGEEDEQVDEEEEEEEGATLSVPVSTKRPLNDTQKTTKRSRRSRDDQLESLVKSIENDTKNALPDEISAYLEHTALRLRGLDRGVRLVVQNEIDNLIFKAEMGLINPPSIFPVQTPLNDHQLYQQSFSADLHAALSL